MEYGNSKIAQSAVTVSVFIMLKLDTRGKKRGRRLCEGQKQGQGCRTIDFRLTSHRLLFLQAAHFALGRFGFLHSHVNKK